MNLTVKHTINAAHTLAAASAVAIVPSDSIFFELPIDYAPVQEVRPSVLSYKTAAQETPQSIEFKLPKKIKWDKEAQQRFKALAIQDATDCISDDESRELESLRRLREKAEYTADEKLVRLNYRRKKALDNLIKAYNEYKLVVRTTN